MMPELDGYGVLHILDKNPKVADIPFIFLTAKADKIDFRKGMNLGADDYITKPFHLAELNSRIKAVLRRGKYGGDNTITFNEIKDSCKEFDIDMIVMGSHGTDGLQEIFIGSNTERVVRSSEIPVLVIKGDVEKFKLERFVFACDFKEESLLAFLVAAFVKESVAETIEDMKNTLDTDRFHVGFEFFGDEQWEGFVFRSDLHQRWWIIRSDVVGWRKRLPVVFDASVAPAIRAVVVDRVKQHQCVGFR